MKSSYASKLRIRVCFPHYTEEEHENIFSYISLYGNTEDSLMTACTPMTDESQWKGERAITLNF